VSNTLAIAATTTALRNLLHTGVPALDSDLSDLDVTTRSPDAARTNVNGTSLNLFLYRTMVNAGWSNTDMPRSVKPGETGYPPLALDLQYLVTAYGRDAIDKDAVSHQVLGGAMSVLHDHPVLGAAEIRSALQRNDLAEQLERIRITWLPLTVDDMSRLWTAFQSQYRVSVAYEVTVVLIDSLRPSRTPLPVLTRGQDDRGVTAVTGGAPVLRGIRPPRSQPAARLGEDVVIEGDHLDADPVIRFASLLPEPPPVVELPRRPPQAGEPAGSFAVRLPGQADDPDALGRWVPGFYTVTAVLLPAGLPPLVSNAIALALAPAITVTPNASGGGVTAAPGTPLTVTCSPRAHPGQRVQLLFGDQVLEPTGFSNPDPALPAFKTTPTTLTFTVPAVDAGVYTVRLRVDGVDSLPVTFAGGSQVPQFDPEQQVRVS
jgi:hypothetical protein